MKKIELMKKLENALLFALVFVTAASCRDGVAREACRRAALPAAEVRAAADNGRTDGRDETDGGETGRAACTGVPVAKSDGRISPSAKALPAAEVRAAADNGRTDGRDGTDGGETGRAACAGAPVAKSDGRIPPSAKKAKAGAHSARPDCPFGEERLFLPGKP